MNLSISLIRLAAVGVFGLTVLLAGTFTRAGCSNPAMATCPSSISPASKSYQADSTVDSIMVTAAVCEWDGVSDVGWITMIPPTGGNGSNPISFRLQANTGAPNTNTASRSGTVSIIGSIPPPLTTLTFTATQSGCSFSVPQDSICVPASQGSYSLSILTGSATSCPWTATSNTSWISISPGSISGSGDGLVSISVARNAGAAVRTGTVSAGGHTVTVNQEGAASCAFPIAPAAQSFSAAGGAGTIAVRTPRCACSWTARSGAAWITIESGNTGSGDGTVSYVVAVNPMNIPRSGTITVVDQTFTVTQPGGASGCMYSLSPTGAAFTAAASAGSFTIAALDGCTWLPNSNASWLTITKGGAGGSGTGQISYTVSANTGPSAREGTVTVADQTFTVDQAAQGDQADLSIAVTGSSSQVAAGTRIIYTIVARNAGPNPATGATLETETPAGTSFASLTGPGSSATPAPGHAGPISAFVGSIPESGSASFTLTLNVLGAPGSTLSESASVSSLTADPVPGNNAAVITTEILGGGIVKLSWDQAPSTAADPTPPPTNLTASPAASASAGQLTAENAVLPESDACTLTGYNVYLSASLPVETIPANLWVALPPTNSAPAPVAPGGSFYVVTTLWNCGGNIIESGLTGSGGSNQTGVPAPPMITSVKVGGKVRTTGSGFSDGVVVFLDGVAFSRPAGIRNNNTLVVQKGGLSDGRGVSDVLQAGKTVLFSFRNSDGGIGAFSYTQQ